ncbi:MAG: 4Fe-4S dicluster domain-containing protein [Candidatus Syntrophoarchaeum sp. WYZ-LMO15]|nr:MAG: 4Fe-4S dicluster domain-containing protein [Candidatus Syntrophoarchaeum sp. WYZ-LMO15]
MCKFCAEHGAGKRWYLNTKNYVDEMVKNDKEREEFVRNFAATVEKDGAYRILEALTPFKSESWMDRSRELREWYIYWHQGQPVTIEETKEIMKIASPIAKVECLCRRVLRAETGGEKYCLLFGMLLDYIRDWPDFTPTGVEPLTVDEAIDEVVRRDREGLVHTVWTFKTPYIAAVCQCATPVCLALRQALDFGYMLHKGEYVGVIDTGKCDGCGECVSRCQFGAIKFDPVIGKAYIDMWKCYGCGVCRAVCDRGAISMRERQSIPELKDEWFEPIKVPGSGRWE